MGGEMSVSVRIMDADMDASNNELSASIVVGRGNNPVVSDLTAQASDEGVRLAWTDPSVESGAEGFENLVPYSYGDMLGDFRTIDRDEMETTRFQFRFPHDMDPKAWQVMNEDLITPLIEEAGFENDFFTAASGSQFIFAIPPFTIYVGDYKEANDWLISPELKAGSTFKFKMTPGFTGYIEYVDVLYSTTDDDPDSFQVLEAHKLLTAEWRDYEYQLPEGAKYMAIRYYGNTEESQMILLDDIEYVPAAESARLLGYDIYRSGSLIRECENVRGSWLDAAPATEEGAWYNIKPVISKNGVTTRGLASNNAYVGASGIDAAQAQQGVVTASAGLVFFKGFQGLPAEIYSADGVKLFGTGALSEAQTVQVPAGIVMARVNGRTYKLRVQ